MGAALAEVVCSAVAAFVFFWIIARLVAVADTIHYRRLEDDYWRRKRERWDWEDDERRAGRFPYSR